MALNLGKAFEKQFQKDWTESFPRSFLYRLPDQMTGMYGSRNIGDFICFNNGKLYVLDTKTIKGCSIPISCLTQLDMMLPFSDVEGCVLGFVIWYHDKDVVGFLSAKQTAIYKEEGKKSVRFDDPNLFVFPGAKKRKFISTDYTSIERM